MSRVAAIILLAISIAPAAGQTKSNAVTIYCSADEAFARPRADVWWSSEIFGTIQLAEAGVLAAYDPPSAKDIPAAYRDPKHYWTAFGLRGRVIAYNPEKTSKDKVPRTWAELARPEYKGKVAIANPIFGTTRGHMATLLTLWGEDAFRKYLMALRDNGVRIADGNSQAVMMVARGEVEFAATDTDDVIVAIGRGDKLEMAFPDLDAPDGKQQVGTLWIPNSVGVVAGGINKAGAKELADYLASAGVEMELSFSESANLPVRKASWDRFSRRMPPGEKEVDRNHTYVAREIDVFQLSAPVDYVAVAAKLRAADAMIKEILLR